MSGPLVQFLRDRLNEDETAARSAGTREARWGIGKSWMLEGVKHQVVGDEEAFCHPHNVDHIARHDPARVLTDVEVKRRITDLMAGLLAAAESDSEVDHYGGLSAAEDTLMLLALPYADHAGYREEWRP